MDMKQIIITRPCPQCGLTSRVNVDPDGYSDWAFGTKPIQEALPELSADDRELLLTGTHPACWDKIFPPDEYEVDYDQMPYDDGGVDAEDYTPTAEESFIRHVCF